MAEQNKCDDAIGLANAPRQAHLQGTQSRHTEANLTKEPALVPTHRQHSATTTNKVVPDDVMKSGYERLRFVCFIPNTIYSDHKSNSLIPDFFELQIKTLYQHAWSQAEHGLGYKPETPLSDEEQRKLAFIEAQS